MKKKNFEVKILATIPLTVPVELTLEFPANSLEEANQLSSDFCVAQVEGLISLGKLKGVKLLKKEFKVDGDYIKANLNKDAKIESFAPGEVIQKNEQG